MDKVTVGSTGRVVASRRCMAGAAMSGRLTYDGSEGRGVTRLEATSTRTRLVASPGRKARGSATAPSITSAGITREASTRACRVS